MLWYKSWLDTRWRFTIGLFLLTCGAAAIVLYEPEVMKLVPLVPTIDTSGAIGRAIQEGAELMRDYRGYIWSQWFRQTPTQLGTLLAILLGSGGLLTQGFGGGASFTLSLPVSRHRLVTTRAAVGLAELVGLMMIPSLVIPLMSPSIGQSYGIAAALVHGVCLSFGGAVFFSLALLLSTMFTDLWTPLMVALMVAVVLALAEPVVPAFERAGVFHLMRGEQYFRSGQIPWIGWLGTGALSGAMLYGAAESMARRDF